MDEIKVPSTRYHKIVNLLCIIILTGTLVFLVTNWTMIPDQIPGHYDSAGVINRWTSKSGLWIVYFVGIINVIIVLCPGILLIERPEPLP